MSIFGNIFKKIFHPSAAASPSQASPAPAAPPSASMAPPPAPAPTADTPSTAVAVDVGAVLEAMASMKDDKGGNYRSSIVDLLKLLDLDSGLGARKELAAELGVHAGNDGTAEQNIALHRAVMAKLAENGGVVPESLRN